jgi:hypothetical protein
MAMNDARDQQDRCVVCGKDVANVWFARLRRGEEWVKVCSPACSMRYTDASQTTGDNHAQEFAADEHRLPFDVKEES